MIEEVRERREERKRTRGGEGKMKDGGGIERYKKEN